LVERRAADPVFAAHLGRLRSSLLLPQYPDDLLFREPARLHVHPLPGDGLYPFLEEIPGLRSMALASTPSPRSMPLAFISSSASSFVVSGPLTKAAAQIAHGSPR